MKFSVIAVGLLSAILVKASIYEVKFENSTIAENCLTINAGYLTKVSTNYYVSRRNLFLINDRACNPVIETEISEVCGGVVSSECF
jgi:hypothetical protein